MNKYVVRPLAPYDFQYEKNYGYGHIGGYEVNVYNNAMAQGPLFFFSTYLPQSKKNDFVLKMNDRKFPLVQVSSFEFGVTILIGAMTGRTFEKKCPGVLAAVVETLESLEAPKCDICPQSGETIDPANCRPVTMPTVKIKIRLSNNAIAVVNSNIEKSNENFASAPNRYLKGFCGVLLGALVGAFLTYVFAYMGFITAFAPLVSIILGVYLYKRFGGKQTYVMILMSFVTTVLVILGTLVLIYISTANVVVAEAGVPLKGMEALSFCLLNSPEFSRVFLIDVALNIFFILLVEALSAIRLSKMIQRPKNLE